MTSRINNTTEQMEQRRMKLPITKVKAIYGTSPSVDNLNLLVNSIRCGKKIRISVRLKGSPIKIYEYGIIEGCTYRKLERSGIAQSREFLKDGGLLVTEIHNVLKYGNPFGDSKTINKIIREYKTAGYINLDEMTLEDLKNVKNDDFRNRHLLKFTSRKEQSKIFNILFDKLNNREETSHDK